VTGPQAVALRCAAADVADLGAFLGRLVRLDPAALVRIRVAAARPGYLAAYARLPFDVLVGRSVRGTLDGDPDQTVSAADLAAGLPTAPAGTGAAVAEVVVPARRDQAWRGPLPPADAWRRLDTVPVGTVRRLVSAGVAAFREAQERVGDPRAGQAAAQALLDHETLTVSDGDRDAVLPLRVLHAAWRMGFLGERDDADCAVSVAGRWVRLAAPFGSAYRDSGGLGLFLS
jgi:hypothetical protein